MINKSESHGAHLTRIAVEAVCPGLLGHIEPSVMMIMGSSVIGDNVKVVFTSLPAHASARNRTCEIILVIETPKTHPIEKSI